MGPGFISPDDLELEGSDRAEWLASMGPGFISPDDTAKGYRWTINPEVLQWGRASSARMTTSETGRLADTLPLQWGRASSARMT